MVNNYLSFDGFPDCDDEAEQMVIFELLVPTAAKVPAPSLHREVAKLMVHQASVTSTVPSVIITDLRVNNTAVASAWCVTASLTEPHSARRSYLLY
jgi:hypothetical protein